MAAVLYLKRNCAIIFYSIADIMFEMFYDSARLLILVNIQSLFIIYNIFLLHKSRHCDNVRVV